MICLVSTLGGHAQLNTDRITAIGRNALYFEDYVLSIQYFNQVIKLKPYLSEPYMFRAIAKIQLGDYTGALQDCEQSIVLNPFQPGAYYTRGFARKQLKDLTGAEADFTQALQFAPDNRTYIMLRADTRSEQGNYTQALEDIDYLLNREPKSPSLLFEKGIICLNRKDTLCALHNFTETTEYDSQNAANWSALGMVNLMMNSEEDALIHLNKAILLGSKWAGDYINRGIIYYRKHNYRGALADYDKAVQLAPNESDCYYNRGILRHELGDYNNALADFNRAIDLSADNMNMRYQRAVTLLQLSQWRDALSDLDTLIKAYPYFLPSYYLAAQAKTALGDGKTAYQYRQTAYQIEQKKDSIQNARKLNTDVQLAQSQPQKRDRRKEFSSRAAQNQDEPAEDKDYASSTRGSVQRKHADVVNEPNFTLSYYTQEQPIRNTNTFHYALDNLNKQALLPSPLRLTQQEFPLDADMINQHFAQIDKLSSNIERRENEINIHGGRDAQGRKLVVSPEWYFARAIEFALVQDYISAIDDCTKALRAITGKEQEKELEAIITFCRANWRYKLLEYQRATGELTAEASMDWDIMLRDYDHVVQLLPDFSYAYYNKANMLCVQKEFQAAITCYTQAIKVDADFAEAYFNRGLTRIFIDDNENGINDLSKAGELGVYQAYNLISRFK
ncbi:MAG: tetratricopeptide repeat protein [Paludibacteraceae bacterium]|nr:tetratricopeptide repeat protein [Paludibacteraceae bacterium]